MKQTKIILTLAVGLLLISCGEDVVEEENVIRPVKYGTCLLYTSPSPRD